MKYINQPSMRANISDCLYSALPIFLFAAMLLLLQYPVYSATISCKDVENSAKTHYSSEDSASSTTNDKNCETSIGGATSDSAFNPSLRRISICAAGLIGNISDDTHLRFYASHVVPFIAGFSVQGFSFPSIGIPSQLNEVGCQAWLDSEAARAGGQLSDSNNPFQLSVDDIDTISSCIANGDGGNSRINCESNGEQILISFTSPFGVHIVSIPFRN